MPPARTVRPQQKVKGPHHCASDRDRTVWGAMPRIPDKRAMGAWEA